MKKKVISIHNLKIYIYINNFFDTTNLGSRLAQEKIGMSCRKTRLL